MVLLRNQPHCICGMEQSHDYYKTSAPAAALIWCHLYQYGASLLLQRSGELTRTLDTLCLLVGWCRFCCTPPLPVRSSSKMLSAGTKSLLLVGSCSQQVSALHKSLNHVVNSVERWHLIMILSAASRYGVSSLGQDSRPQTQVYGKGHARQQESTTHLIAFEPHTQTRLSPLDHHQVGFMSMGPSIVVQRNDGLLYGHNGVPLFGGIGGTIHIHITQIRQKLGGCQSKKQLDCFNCWVDPPMCRVCTLWMIVGG